ncbi:MULTISPECIES: monovalent cation/H(+) antiporter subunit G [unclassified Micromonospora]|uniref:monovalent cation/H(+) antiporter subunit G n=1 Tax=unclassified Micromonospora TaxID=2617518 RepID=UPI0022C5A320|nr:monovalent cation/H(+) antiporter subunit G [Micromonospora sp. AKA38]GHJ16192.1 putative cation antiporter subunit [Micromonospora sp. AKA38]
MTVDALLDTAAGVCLIAGALLSLAAGIALVRFPDVLSRMHAAAKPQVLGLLLVLLGCALRLRTGVDITTLVLVGMFQLATAPVAAHMVGRAAYPHDDIRRDLLLTDELAGRLDRVRASRAGAAETPSTVGAPGRDARPPA